MKHRKGLYIGIAIAIVLIIVIISVPCSSYNKLVDLSQKADAQWAQVETQYQRRFDLIPNLVESVKGIYNQEKTIFDNLAQARTKYGQASTPDQQAAAGSEVETALGRLLVIIENYPELRSSTAVITLMDELAGTENRISVERGRFNTTVRDYNTYIKKFPSNIMASLFNYNERAYFKSTTGADQAPIVEFE